MLDISCESSAKSNNFGILTMRKIRMYSAIILIVYKLLLQCNKAFTEAEGKA